MDSKVSWGAGFIEQISDQLQVVVSHLPEFIGAVLVLILGWFLARALRRGTQRVSQTSNRILRRLFPTGILANMQVSPFATKLVGEIVFWCVLFLALAISVRIAGLTAMAESLQRIAVYLPNIFVSVAILLSAYVLGVFIREQFVSQSASISGKRQAAILGKGTQVLVFTVALIMALDQLGVDVALLIVLIAIAAAAFAITFGVSIALGARSYMRNVIGMRSVQGQLSEGLTIRIKDVVGQVLELTHSQVVLETKDGKVIIPGHYVCEAITLVLAPDIPEESNNG